MQIDAFGGHFENSSCRPFPWSNLGTLLTCSSSGGYTDQKDQKTFSCNLFRVRLYIDPTIMDMHDGGLYFIFSIEVIDKTIRLIGMYKAL